MELKKKAEKEKRPHLLDQCRWEREDEEPESLVIDTGMFSVKVGVVMGIWNPISQCCMRVCVCVCALVCRRGLQGTRPPGLFFQHW